MDENTEKEKLLKFINIKGDEWFTLKENDYLKIYYPKRDDKGMGLNYDLVKVKYHTPESFFMYEYGDYPEICGYDYFAEWVEKENLRVVLLRKNLPEYCYTLLNDRGQIAKLTKGKEGYEIIDELICINSNLAQQLVNDLNNKLGGVSPEQEVAMYIGAMSGWDKAGADPDFYKGTSAKIYLEQLLYRKSKGE